MAAQSQRIKSCNHWWIKLSKDPFYMLADKLGVGTISTEGIRRCKKCDKKQYYDYSEQRWLSRQWDWDE